jgi:predicted site-specific integrase-resolvase
MTTSLHLVELIHSERTGVEVVVMEQLEKPTFEQELVNDMLELVTVVSARLYGARSGKGRAAVTAVKDALRP